MTQLTDIFGQPVSEGDYIAAGMSYGQSSVLRVGKVLAIKETDISYRPDAPLVRWNIRVRWRNNGRSEYRWDTKESSIKYESGFSYAKLLVLPPDMVEKFPADIEDE